MATGFGGAGNAWRGLIFGLVVVAASGADGPAEKPRRIEVSKVENAFRLSPRLYSGGQPEGPEAFAALKALGIKMIVSVDGARPDVEAAREQGIRYVHLPVGYDGIGRDQALRLIKTLKAFPGPVFIHCHHGKHRGPTAAALCGMASDGWGKEQALAWMRQAGTSADYRGLFATVGSFGAPTAAELEAVAADLPERADVPALVEVMTRVDETWDGLKAVQAAGFRAPPAFPDLDPPHEALQLAEHFRELLRLPEIRGKGQEFLRALESSEARATRLESAFRSLRVSPTAEAKAKAGEAFRGVATACTDCHAQFRDNRKR